jgi:hypothetical protein
MVMGTGKEVEMDDRRQQAVERILGDVSLTDYLDDMQGSRLLNWGAQLARWQVVQTAVMGAEQADAFIDERVQGVRKIIRRINRLVGELPDLAADEIAERLGPIFDAAAGLTGTQPRRPGDLNAYAVRLQAMEQGAALTSIMGVLEGEEREI